MHLSVGWIKNVETRVQQFERREMSLPIFMKPVRAIKIRLIHWMHYGQVLQQKVEHIHILDPVIR